MKMRVAGAMVLISVGFVMGGTNACTGTVTSYGQNLSAGMKTPETSKLFVAHTDEVTRVVSYLLKPGLFAPNQQSIYFTAKSMTDDGRFLMFWIADDERVKGGKGKRTAVIDFMTETFTELADGPGSSIPWMDVKEDRIWFVNADGVHRRDLLADPQKDVLLCPLPEILRAQTRLCTHLTPSADRTKVFLDTNGEHGEVQGALDIKSGVFTVWGRTDFVCNHGQFHPFNDRLALCAWENASTYALFEYEPDERPSIPMKRPPLVTDIRRDRRTVYPRLWIMQADGTQTMIPVLIHGYASHEEWTEDGQGIYWCDRGVDLMDCASGVQRLVTPIPAQHATLTKDLRYVTFDCSHGGWWRGCAWTCAFWNRDTHRGVYIHRKRPVYMPKDRPSRLHPDPHPQFVCGDRYVVSTMNDPYRMNVSVTPVAELVRITSDPATAPQVKRQKLNWRTGMDTRTPYEITLSAKELAKTGNLAPPPGLLNGLVHNSFALEAVVDGTPRRVPLTGLTVWEKPDLGILRFRVPEGTTELALLADVPERFEFQDADHVDNLLFGLAAPAATSRWSAVGMIIGSRRDGILLSGKGEARTACAVPRETAGSWAAFDLDVRNQSRSGAKFRVRLLPRGCAVPVFDRTLSAKGREVVFVRERVKLPMSVGEVAVSVEPLDPDSRLLVSRMLLRPGVEMALPPCDAKLFAESATTR